jgi:hypothetical protein
MCFMPFSPAETLHWHTPNWFRNSVCDGVADVSKSGGEMKSRWRMWFPPPSTSPDYNIFWCNSDIYLCIMSHRNLRLSWSEHLNLLSTGIIRLNNGTHLIFLMAMCRVFFAVRTEFLNIQTNCDFRGLKKCWKLFQFACCISVSRILLHLMTLCQV